MSQNDDYDYDEAGDGVDEVEVEDTQEDGEGGDDYEYTEEDDANWMEAATPTGVKAEQDFKVMNAEELINQQQQEVINVSEVLSIPVSVSGALLRANGWNRERLYAAFFEDKERVCKKAGVTLTSETLKKGRRGDPFTCFVCFDDYDAGESASLACNHAFCKKCWKEYLEVKIHEGPSCLMTSCPYAKCEKIVDESVFREFVGTDYFKRYSKFLSRSFVDDNPHIKWCPAPDCGKALFCPDATQTVVKCSCGTKFCFKCNFEAHAPATCPQLKEWQKKEKDESETANWLAANTKDCPKCHTAIEKNGGCNHMTCSRCRYEWCWVCMDDWTKHGSATGGYYNCNRFNPVTNEERSRESARTALERYMHYYHRYANHDRSRKLESQLRKKSEEKMKELQQINKYSSWIDVEYIQKSVEQLIECRSTLKYTYVFAFYLDAGPEKNLFEYLQEDLERTTERLSEILEAPTEKFDRDEIISTTKSAEKRLHHLLTGVERGLTTDK